MSNLLSIEPVPTFGVMSAPRFGLRAPEQSSKLSGYLYSSALPVHCHWVYTHDRVPCGAPMSAGTGNLTPIVVAVGVEPTISRI